MTLVALMDDLRDRHLDDRLFALASEYVHDFRMVMFEGLSEDDRLKVRSIITISHKIGADDIARWKAILPNLGLVAAAMTGIDGVDISACADHHVEVRNVPNYATVSVAELVIGLALSILRAIPQADRCVKQGKWDRGLPPGHTLQGRNVGIVGTGAIGTCTAEKFARLGCTVYGWNRSKGSRSPQFMGRYMDDLDDLLGLCDIVSLHLRLVKPPSEEPTEHIIDARRLSLMRPTSVLINAARAELVDNYAFADALIGDRIYGAASDVFEKGDNPDVSQDPLLRVPAESLIVTPHIGYKTEEALDKLARLSLENVRQFVADLRTT